MNKIILILVVSLVLSFIVFKNIPMNSIREEIKTEKAMFGAGCFWGVEDVFLNTRGVVSTAVGFSGGDTENPTYEEVSSGETGHVEVVYLEYDPTIVTYEELLSVFWNKHNPTLLNRQGVDVGFQYNSIIFYFNKEQKMLAEKSKDEFQKSGKYSELIVTKIVPEQPFYRAEEYHQRYIQKGRTCNS